MKFKFLVNIYSPYLANSLFKKGGVRFGDYFKRMGISDFGFYSVSLFGECWWRGF